MHLHLTFVLNLGLAMAPITLIASAVRQQPVALVELVRTTDIRCAAEGFEVTGCRAAVAGLKAAQDFDQSADAQTAIAMALWNLAASEDTPAAEQASRDQARSAASRATELAPQSTKAWRLRASLAEDETDQLSILRQGIAKVPESAEILENLALVLADRSELEEAAAHYLALLRLGKTKGAEAWSARTDFVETLRGANRLDLAAAVLTEILNRLSEAPAKEKCAALSSLQADNYRNAKPLDFRISEAKSGCR